MPWGSSSEQGQSLHRFLALLWLPTAILLLPGYQTFKLFSVGPIHNLLRPTEEYRCLNEAEIKRLRARGETHHHAYLQARLHTPVHAWPSWGVLFSAWR
jgi:hypothetical protein